MDSRLLDRSLPPPRLLTTHDLARMLGLSVRTARRYLREGRLPGTRLGNRWYASREAIVDRIEGLSADELRAEQRP